MKLQQDEKKKHSVSLQQKRTSTTLLTSSSFVFGRGEAIRLFSLHLRQNFPTFFSLHVNFSKTTLETFDEKCQKVKNARNENKPNERLIGVFQMKFYFLALNTQ